MRLLQVETQTLHTFYGDAIPPYAILSHRWGKEEDEVSFSQMQNLEQCREMLGYKKIAFSCAEAKRNQLGFAWIDTCCIDKSSSSELSEAINSMFDWYAKSSMCYVYLSDVDQHNMSLWSSSWWTRSWTLQELIAPKKVSFFDKDWTWLGTKQFLVTTISSKTKIDKEALQHPGAIAFRSAAQKMCWASSRNATRQEDLAYSLLGIFNIHMSLQYGEGEDAFVRLQKEILKESNDQSLFAWGFARRTFGKIVQEQDVVANTEITYHEPQVLEESSHGMFASEPKLFHECDNIISCFEGTVNSHLDIKHGKLEMQMPLISAVLDGNSIHHDYIESDIGLLACMLQDAPQFAIGILLGRTGASTLRVSPDSSIYTCLVPYHTAFHARTHKILISPTLQAITESFLSIDWQCGIMVDFPDLQSKHFRFAGARPTGWKWHEAESMLTQSDMRYLELSLTLGFYDALRNRLLCLSLERGMDMSAKEIGIRLSYIPATEHSKETVLDQVRFLDMHDYVNVGTQHFFQEGFTIGYNYRTVLNHSIHRLGIREGSVGKPFPWTEEPSTTIRPL